MPGTRKKTTMSADHKRALAEGRELSRVVKSYLDALEERRPKRGRKRTPDSIKKRLATIDASLPKGSSVQRLQLVQERLDLAGEMARLGETTDLSGLEKNFIKAAKPYSQNKGISYAAWRELGVTADVLKQAGITRAG